jgi:hypothetical protein
MGESLYDYKHMIKYARLIVNSMFDRKYIKCIIIIYLTVHLDRLPIGY